MVQKVELRENGTKRVVQVNVSERRAEQHHKQICDINHIVRRFQKTGLVDHVSSIKGSYDDFTGIGSYHECMNKLIRAEEDFLKLPASIRKEFDNDAGVLLDEIQKPENYDKMVKLGLLNPKPSVDVSVPADAGEDSAQ